MNKKCYFCGEESITKILDKYICNDCLIDKGFKEPEKIVKLKKPNLSNLEKQVDDYVNGIDCDHVDCDCAHFIFEAAITSYYGEDVFLILNKRKERQY